MARGKYEKEVSDRVAAVYGGCRDRSNPHQISPTIPFGKKRVSEPGMPGEGMPAKVVTTT